MKTVDQVIEDLKKEPPSEDIIKDLLPNSTTAYMLICGRAGIGKTNLVLYLAYSIATGRKFFSLETKQETVGYLSFEGGRHQIANRFHKLMQTFGSAGDYLRWEHTMPIKLNSKGKDELKRLISGLDVAIIDPLRPLVCGDCMKPADASAFLENLRDVQNDTGAVIILVHHIRKPDRKLRVLPEDLQFEIKGLTEYVDGAATVLLLDRPRHSRDESGRFSSNPDDRILYFPKIKDAPTEFRPMKLRLNRDELIFKPIIDRYEDEEEGGFS
ncbi:AAA family ATPase [Chloroflexota bacterium]